ARETRRRQRNNWWRHPANCGDWWNSSRSTTLEPRRAGSTIHGGAWLPEPVSSHQHLRPKPQREINSEMPPIRILVVDDSVVIRKVLCETLAEDPELEVLASASDGKIGLAKIAQLHPDIVTLDIEMPVMNGLQTLIELRKLYAKLPVIIFS